MARITNMPNATRSQASPSTRRKTRSQSAEPLPTSQRPAPRRTGNRARQSSVDSDRSDSSIQSITKRRKLDRRAVEPGSFTSIVLSVHQYPLADSYFQNCLSSLKVQKIVKRKLDMKSTMIKVANGALQKPLLESRNTPELQPTRRILRSKCEIWMLVLS